MFKDWLIVVENSEEQRSAFVTTVKKYFPDAVINERPDGNLLWADIHQAGRLLKLNWQRGLEKVTSNPLFGNLNTSQKDVDMKYSSVYITFTNIDGNPKWGQTAELRPGSLTFSRTVKALAKELTDAGMAIDFVPSDNKRHKKYSNALNQMNINKVGGTSYWAKEAPPEFAKFSTPTPPRP